jgi:quercetin dioxygenase-like cupin family protein
MFGHSLRATTVSLLLATAGSASAEQAGIPATRGVSARPMTALEFGTDMPNLAGQAMRMRQVSIAPGGCIDVHSHRGRPALLYIVEGSIVERRGEAVREYRAGESYAIGGDISHAIENPGPVPAIYLEVDIVPARN